MNLGSVPYLNARPLLHGLDARLAAPSQLARWLRAGEVGAALVPVVEAMENPEYWLVDGVCIGCDGPVYSVILALGKPLPQIRRVHLDPASKTSVRLTRWLLERHFALPVEYVEAAESADARLIIGDPAIAFRQASPKAEILDLGAAWKMATRLPFVFAVWASRAPDPALAEALRAAASEGLAARANIPEERLWERRYLTEFIRYELGTLQKEALAKFAELLDLPWSPRWI